MIPHPEEANVYSAEWFAFFHKNIPPSRTELECEFIREICPLVAFPRILDVCCGMGRHARLLAAEGYAVTGIDRDAEAIAEARLPGAGSPVFLRENILAYEPEREAFDAVLILSQSFGFFTEAENLAVLSRLGPALRRGGRMILDLWNPAFFPSRLAPRHFEMPQGRVLETKKMEGDRLSVRLDYPDGGHEYFSWQTFSETQMAILARRAGLRLRDSHSDFDGALAPTPDKPKIQFVLDRP